MVTQRLRSVLSIAIVAILLLGADAKRAGAAADAVTRCQELLPGFVKNPARLSIETQTHPQDQVTGVRLSWPLEDNRGEGWIICWFLPRHSESEEWQITQIDSSHYGTLRRYDIQQLYKRLWAERYQPQAFSPESDTATGHVLYVLQQIVNAISLGCVYGLIALGFTLVYGITRVINFAFGDIYMLGAFLAFIATFLIRALGGSASITALLLVLVATAPIIASYGWTMDRLVFRPLRGAQTTVALIAAIGLSLLLKDSVRLLQGPKTRYLLVENLTSWPVVTGHGFDVYVSKGHLFVGLATAAICAALWWVQTRTSFGRCQRACAQDLRMAQLLGVPTERTIGLTFMIGTTLTGAGGLFAAAQYGVINFPMGTLMGFKALTAALLGGIGSLPGAVLGGMLIALTECFTAAFVGSEWKDIAVFAALVLVLLYRPGGILGTEQAPPADARI